MRKTKTLFIGDTSLTSTSRFYADSLEALGHTVTRVAPRLFETGSLIDRLWIGLSKTPPPRAGLALEQTIEQHLKKAHFDLVLVFAENFIRQSTLELIKHSGAKLVYHSHDNNFSEGILKPTDFFQRLKLYDFVFTTKSQNTARYLACGIDTAMYIPSAFAPQVHRPLLKGTTAEASISFPISFVGTYDHSRDPLLHAIGWENLYIWGNGWKRFDGFKNYSRHITPKAIYNDDFTDVISRSGMSLGLLRTEAEDRHTQRTFEIPACGTLQIAPRNDEILGFFEENREIICFGSTEELKEKTQYYLSHPKERREIAVRGYERVVSGKHSYRNRVETILSAVSKQS